MILRKIANRHWRKRVWNLRPPEPSQVAEGRSERPDLAGRRKFLREHILIHTHIPKTGGSTIAAGLSAIVGGTHALDVRLKRSVPFGDMDQADLDDIHLISGHFDFGLHEEFNRQPLYIAGVREPVARAVSGYRYLTDREGQVDHKHVAGRNFDEAWHALDAHYGVKRHNGQAKMLMGGDPAEAVEPDDLWRQIDGTYFLLIPQPRINHALQHLRAAFGVAWTRIVPHNISRAPKVEVSDAMRRKILDVNLLDAELFDRAERDFDASLKRACDYIASHCLLPLKDGPD